MKIAIYPGSFDPITLGHLNIIRRVSYMFEEVIVCVMRNDAKSSGMFSIDERCDMVISIGEKKKIDKVHAAFELKMGKWNVIDQSKAGVWVNDVKLAPNSPKTLEEGDVIDLGQRFKLRFM